VLSGPPRRVSYNRRSLQIPLILRALRQSNCKNRNGSRQEQMVVHLHWSKNPKLVRETRTGITVCGIKARHATN